MKRITGLCIFASCLTVQLCTAQGPITPSTAPTPMMKTLQQIEPRRMIKAVPMTITQSGSYYFTTNLICNSISDAIKVQVPDVTIDMRGFTLTGQGMGSSGNGIICTMPNLKVFNGNIVAFVGDPFGTGITGAGINCIGKNAIFRDIKLENNGNGLIAGNNARIDSVSAYFHEGNGIEASSGSVLNGCRADSNFGDGIIAGPASTLTKCTAQQNSFNGIRISSAAEETESCAVIDKCTANLNELNGIFAESGANIVDCTANGNGFLEPMGNANGIHVAANGVTPPFSAGSIVRNCTANNNMGDGIRVVSDTEVIGNSACGNGRGFNMGGAWAGIGVYGDNNRVVDNVTSSNLGIPDGNPPWPVVGILVEGYKNRIEANHSSGNATWAYMVTLTDNFIVKNTAYGKPQGVPDYNIVAGNHVGTILNPAACTAIPAVGVGGLGIAAAVTDTPWANFDD